MLRGSQHLPIACIVAGVLLVLCAGNAMAQLDAPDELRDRVEVRRSARERLQHRLERLRDASPEQRRRLREELKERWHSADRLQRDDLHDRAHALRQARRDARLSRLAISPDALERQRGRLEGREAQREMVRALPQDERRALARSLLEMTPDERAAVRERIAERPGRGRDGLGERTQPALDDDQERARSGVSVERWSAMGTDERDDARRRMHRLHALSPVASTLGED